MTDWSSVIFACVEYERTRQDTKFQQCNLYELSSVIIDDSIPPSVRS